MLEWLVGNDQSYLFMASAAAFGGLASFLLMCKLGQIRNNRHIRKAMIEIVGGSIVGFFLSMPIPSNYQIGTAFCGGVAWSTIMNVIRRKATSIVEAAFFGPPENRGTHQARQRQSNDKNEEE